MNKRGDEGEHLLSVWMFLIWIIVGIGIMGGIYLFYSTIVDVREIQAEFLVRRAVECINEKGLVENFFEDCGLNEEVLSGENFFLRVNIIDAGIEKNLVKKGNPDIETQCILREEAEAQNFARCSFFDFEKEVDGKVVKIFVDAGSNNLGGKLYG